MPYLTPEARDLLLTGDNTLCLSAIRTPGDLNYAMTQTVLAFVNAQIAGQGKYAIYNAAIGALECCKLELYRRVVAEYENLKCKENGEIY